MVGCVSPVARAAADRLPRRITARKDRSRLQSDKSIIRKRIASQESLAIFVSMEGRHSSGHSRSSDMPTSPSTPTALILGLTGAIGGAIAETLARRGYTIRALTRRPPGARPVRGFPIDWREGDAREAASVRAAAEGASLIVYGVNPPGYARWREDALPMLANTIAAAKPAGATIVFPGNVYVYSS